MNGKLNESPESCGFFKNADQCIEKTHCLLWKSGPEVEVVARVVDVGVARVQCLVLLLLRHLLDRQEPVLPHLAALRHVAHARVF